MNEKALGGVKILEYASFVSGPYCSKLLADLGAETIKIEEPLVGDDARRMGPFQGDIPHIEKSGLFLYLNTNKKGITLNVKTQTGEKTFLELVKWADVLIEDKPPREMIELELTYETLKKINPKLVMTSITPFGQTGPYRDFKAYQLNITHASGGGYLLPISENLEREPLKPGGHFDGYICGLSAATATLGGIYWQRATGSGQHIDCSKQDMIMDIDKVMITSYPNVGAIATRVPVTSVSAMTNLRCKDGYIWLLAMFEPHWEAIFKMIGNPDWVDPFRDSSYRDKNIGILMGRVEEWTESRGKQEVYKKAQELGCPAGIVRSAEDLLEWDQLRSREFFVEVDHPIAGRFEYPRVAYRLSDSPVELDNPAPFLGQHNEEIYTGILDYTKSELVNLKEARII